MIVTVQEVTLSQPPSGAPRTPGVHLSGIIRCIAFDEGLLEMGEEEDSSIAETGGDSQRVWWENLDNTSKIRVSIGLAWEQWYIATQLPSVVDHPGELVVDGVFMTPDGEELAYLLVEGRERHTPVVHEVKATYKSIKTVGGLTTRKAWMWVAQIKAYAKAMGTRHAVLHVLFLCGDYSWPQRPKMLRYVIEFTQEEVDSNWELLRDYRDYRMSIERA